MDAFEMKIAVSACCNAAVSAGRIPVALVLGPDVRKLLPMQVFKEGVFMSFPFRCMQVDGVAVITASPFSMAPVIHQ